MNPSAADGTAPVVHPARRRFAGPLPWVAGFAILAIGGAAIAPWTISRGALREEIAGQLRSSAGLYVFPRGAAHVSLLPRPRIRLDDVALVDPNGALVVETASLTGDVRLLSLLGGRLEVTEVDLVRPRISIDIDRAPLTTAGAAVRVANASADSPEGRKADAARLGVLSLSDGTVTLRRNGVSVGAADKVNARLDWRGARQQFILWVSQPASLLRGGNSPLTLQVRSPATTVNMAGSVNVAVKPRYEGQLQIATTSLPAFLSSLDLGLSAPPALSAITLAGDLVATPSSATVTNLRLEAGGESFEGTLALQGAPGARPLLSGTLATPSLSLTPYLSPVALTGPDGRPNSEPFDVAVKPGPDLDLRLSAGRLRYQRLQARDAALSVLTRDGRTELSIADATAYGGAFKGRAVAETRTESGQTDIQATLLMRGIDWAALDRDLSGQDRLTGTADVAASLQASGSSILQLMRSLTGSGRVALKGGDLGGLDIPGTLARLDKRPLAAATDLGSGRTRFDQANLPFEIEGGVAKIDKAEIVAQSFAMVLSGSIQIPDGQTAMTAAVRPASAANDAAGFAFDVAGPWNRPTFTPDVRGLIRRSGAASPLFAAPVAAQAAEARSSTPTP